MKKRILPLILVIIMLLGSSCASAKPAEADTAEKVADVVAEQLVDVDSPAAMVPLTSSTEAVCNIKAEDWSYVRGGNYKSQTSDQMEGGSTDIIWAKSNNQYMLEYSHSNSRQFYLRFDVSGLADVIDNYKSAGMTFSIINSIAEDADKFNVYQITENIDISALTWDTKVNGTLVDGAEGIGISSLERFNYITAVKNAITNNNGILILRFVQSITATGATQINCADGKQPYLSLSVHENAGAYATDFFADSDDNDAVWAHAKAVYDSWYGRYQEILNTDYTAPELIVSDENQYGITVNTYGTKGTVTTPTARETRTFDQLTDLNRYVSLNIEYKYDEYGGIMDPALKQDDATGFFYTKKLGDRWWVIDPNGYPCYIRALSGVTIEYSKNSRQRPAALAKFGSEEKWALSTVRRIYDDLGFNISTSGETSVRGVPNGLFYQVGTGAFAGGYGSQIGVNASVGGSTVFSENNTMPAFDPGFESFAATRAESSTAKYVGDKKLLGYTTDNELPMQETLLEDYLTIDPFKVINDNLVNVYSYACAWYWLVQQSGNDQPTEADITDELSELFRGFLWDRYFDIVCGAMRTAMAENGSDHMLLGTRFLTRVKDAEWVLKFAGYHLDAMTINWYSAWQPQAEDLQRIARYSKLPIMITEFYAKAKDNEEPELLIHKDTSAGWLVETQADRGYFYQNFTLRLLECKSVIGWHWFQYLDCDPLGTQTDKSSMDSNKGIVSNSHTEYTDLTDRMIEINKNVYHLIDYFDAKYAE